MVLSLYTGKRYWMVFVFRNRAFESDVNGQKGRETAEQ